METLKQISDRSPLWSLEEFVPVVNALLPQYLPLEKSSTRRSLEEVTPRLIRYYGTQGLLDDAVKDGRSARYTYRHLLQVLVARRLLSEGFGMSAMQSLLHTKSNSDLEALLQGGVQLTLAPANPALAFLQKVKQRSAAMPQSLGVSMPQAPLAPVRSSQVWTRVDILPGLELHLSQDFVLPNSPQEQANLAQAILNALRLHPH